MRLAPFLAATIAVELLACSGPAVSAPPPPPVDWRAFDVHRAVDAGPVAPTAAERALAEAYAAALSSPAFAELGARLDRDVHFSFPGMSDERGRDSVIRAHDSLFGAFEPRTFATSRVWRSDSVQALEWTLSGVQVRDWMGAPATRRTVAIPGVTLLSTKDDGSITDCHVYFDVASAKARLGAGTEAAHEARPGHAANAGDAGASAPVSSPPPAPSFGPPQVYEQTASPDEERQVAVARAALDALESSDEAAYLSAMTADVELLPADRAERRKEAVRGKEAMRAQFKSLHKAIAQLDTTVQNAWGIASFVILEYSISGEQLGPIGPVPLQRDRVVRLHVVDVIAMEGGKIARIWRYDNPAELTATP